MVNTLCTGKAGATAEIKKKDLHFFGWDCPHA